MSLFRALSIFGFLGFVFWGCGGGGGSGGGGTSFTPTGGIIAVAEQSGSNVTIKVGGTKGAAPAGSTVTVTDLNTGVMQPPTTAKTDGSFDPTFTGSTSDMFEVVVSENGTTIIDKTIGVTVISKAVTRNIASFGSFPTAIEIRGNRAYVLLFSNSIQIFDLNQDPPQQIGTIVLPPGSDPVAIAFLNDTRAYVANNVGQSVALVNVETKQCEFLIVRSDHVPSDASICNNQVMTVDNQFFEDPTGIAIANGKVYVTNSNLDLFFQPLGNGFITIIDTTTNPDVHRISATGANSGGITLINGNLYVVNGGHIFFNITTDASSCDVNFPPSIDVINTQSDTIAHTIDIPISSDNPQVCSPGRIEPTPDGRFGYMGLGLVGALLKLNLENNTVVNGPDNPIVITDLSGLNFSADVQIRDDGLGFITLFNTDQIAVIDTETDTINPFPFIVPFPAGLRADNPVSQLFDGVQNLAIRPGADFQGADIFFITNISQELGSINTALVLPPQ